MMIVIAILMVCVGTLMVKTGTKWLQVDMWRLKHKLERKLKK